MNKFASKSSKSSVSKSSTTWNPHDEVYAFRDAHDELKSLVALMGALLPNLRSDEDDELIEGLAGRVVFEQPTKQRNATHYLLRALLSTDAFKGKRE